MTIIPEALPHAPATRAKDLMRAFPAGPPQRLRILIGAALCVLWAMSMFAGAGAMLNDPDTLWHIALGRDIWASGAFPHVDAYSHSFAGEPWIAKEWLSQIALYAAYAAGGWNGVAVFTVAVLVIVFAQVYWALSAHLKPIVAGGLAIGAMSLASDVFVARPHIVVLPVLIVFIERVWSAAREGRAPALWLLGLMCLWANLHASFTFGVLAAALAFALYVEQSRDYRSRRALCWIAFLALAPLAAIIHPYGVQSIVSTLSVAQSEALPYIQEWRAFSITEDPKMAFALFALFAAALGAGLRAPISTTLFVGLVIYMYLTHTRFSYLLALLTPIVLAPDLARHFRALSFQPWAAGLERSRLEAALAPRAGAGAIALAAVAVVAAAAFQLSAHTKPPASSYPVAAIEAARQAGVKGAVLNSYGFGGALIFEGVATFIDGRADRLFQNGFMPEIEQTQSADGEQALIRQIEQYGLAWSLLERDDGRIAHLDSMPDWTRVYEDDFAVVHKRAPRR